MVERRTQRPAEEEEEDNTLSLAQMEETLKPQALEKFADHHLAVQEILQGPVAPGSKPSPQVRDFPPADEKKYHKLREQLTAEVESVQFHASQDRISRRAAVQLTTAG